MSNNELERRYYKLVFRKLPERGYTEEDFKENLQTLYKLLQINPKLVLYVHFIDGKSSKRRGPISSTGFISTSEEAIAIKILKYFSSPGATFVSSNKINPAIDIENPTPVTQLYYKLPEVSLALYPKAFKLKERPDKLHNTYEESEDYKAFLAQLDTPLQLVPSTEGLLEKLHVSKAATEDDPKNTPMLVYLRKLGEKKVAEKKAAAALKSKPSKVSADNKAPKKSAGPPASAGEAKTALKAEKTAERKGESKKTVAPKQKGPPKGPPVESAVEGAGVVAAKKEGGRGEKKERGGRGVGGEEKTAGADRGEAGGGRGGRGGGGRGGKQTKREGSVEKSVGNVPVITPRILMKRPTEEGAAK